jgi:hypothetical protein
MPIDQLANLVYNRGKQRRRVIMLEQENKQLENELDEVKQVDQIELLTRKLYRAVRSKNAYAKLDEYINGKLAPTVNAFNKDGSKKNIIQVELEKLAIEEKTKQEATEKFEAAPKAKRAKPGDKKHLIALGITLMLLPVAMGWAMPMLPAIGIALIALPFVGTFTSKLLQGLAKRRIKKLSTKLGILQQAEKTARKNFEENKPENVVSAQKEDAKQVDGQEQKQEEQKQQTQPEEAEAKTPKKEQQEEQEQKQEDKKEEDKKQDDKKQQAKAKKESKNKKQPKNKTKKDETTEENNSETEKEEDAKPEGPTKE